MNFLSDNTAGASPKILRAIIDCNDGLASPYGNDDWTKRAEEEACRVFERDVALFLVTTGTAANALALSAIASASTAIFCHERAHINDSESGAPELFVGNGKLVGLPGLAGKLTLEALSSILKRFPSTVARQVQPSALSLSQATESATVYSVTEITALAGAAHDAGLAVHMDGARFANALVTIGGTPAEMTWKAGVDALSLGTSKNGTVVCEAVVFFDRAKAAGFAFRHKRGGQTVSKNRFLGAQLCAYFNDGHWLDLARHANRAATRLAAGLAGLPDIRLPWPTEANAVFAVIPRELDRKLKAAGARYLAWGWRLDGSAEQPGPDAEMIRLVCSFATTDEEVDRFIDLCCQG